MATEQALSAFADILNDILFEHISTDTEKVLWLGEGRWLIFDVIDPENLFTVEIRPAKVVAE